MQSVRREDVEEDFTNAPVDHEGQKEFLERFPVKYKFTSVATTSLQEQDEKVDEEEKDSGVAFRLFAPSKSKKDSGIAHIRLESPIANNTEPGLLRTRPMSYYFKEAPSGQEEAGQSGRPVLVRARQRLKPPGGP